MIRPLALILCTAAAPALALDMPENYIGGWGLSEPDCRNGPGSEGYLEITASGLRFYESTGRLEAYETIDKPGLLFDLAFSGEGETWTEQMYLEVDGRTLTRIDISDDRGGLPITYISCS